MEIHRARFIEYNPSGITHIATTPPSFPYPLVAVSRASGDIEIWMCSLLPFTISTRPFTTSTSTPTSSEGGVDYSSWICHAVIAGSSQDSIEELCWTLDRTSADDEEGEDVISLRLFGALLSGWIVEYDLHQMIPRRRVDTHGGGGGVWSMCTWDDRFLAVGCEDGGVRLFDLTGDGGLEFVRAFERQGDRVVSLVWTGVYLCSGSSDGMLRLWDCARGRCVGRMSAGRKKARGEDLYVWSLVSLNGGDGSVVVSGDSLGCVKFWVTTTQTLLQSITTHAADVLTVCTNGAGTAVFASGIDSQIVLLIRNAQTGLWSVRQSRRPHSHDVRAMAWIQLRAPLVLASTNKDADSSLVKRKLDHDIRPRYGRNASPLLADIMFSGGVDTVLTLHRSPRREFGNTSFQPIRLSQITSRPVIDTSMPGHVLALVENHLKLYALGKPLVNVDDPPGLVALDAKPKYLLEVKPSLSSQNITAFCINSSGSLIFAADAAGSNFVYALDLSSSPSADDDQTGIVKYQLPGEFRCTRSLFIGEDTLVLGGIASVRVMNVSLAGRINDDITYDLNVDSGLLSAADVVISPIVTLCASQSGHMIACGDIENRVFVVDLRNSVVNLMPVMKSCIHSSMTFTQMSVSGKKGPRDILCVASSTADSVTGKPSVMILMYDIADKCILADHLDAFRAVNWFQMRRQKVIQMFVTDDDNEGKVLYLNACNWVSRIRIDALMQAFDEYKQANSAEEADAATEAIERLQLCVKTTQRFENLIFFGPAPPSSESGNGRTELIAVERPWRLITDSFPPAFEFKQYGK